MGRAEENPRELSVDYKWELLLRIMSGNYYLYINDAEKLRFIGILARLSKNAIRRRIKDVILYLIHMKYIITKIAFSMY